MNKFLSTFVLRHRLVHSRHITVNDKSKTGCHTLVNLTCWRWSMRSTAPPVVRKTIESLDCQRSADCALGSPILFYVSALRDPSSAILDVFNRKRVTSMTALRLRLPSRSYADPLSRVAKSRANTKLRCPRWSRSINWLTRTSNSSLERSGDRSYHNALLVRLRWSRM